MLPPSLKHNDFVATVAKSILKQRTRALEKVIFTATTGRSGTKTLATLFSTVPGCVAVHEPYPKMNGPLLRAASYGDTATIDRVYRRVKSVNILRSAIGARYYLEASHLVLKTFMRQAYREFGDRLHVIHLVRPHIDVALSIYRLENEPGTEEGNAWWLDFKAPTNRIQMSGLLQSDPEFSHPFYKCLWYCFEIESRVAALHREFPALRMIHFETEDFNDRQKVFGLLEQLGIEFDAQRLAPAVGQREHTKDDQKVRSTLPREQAQEMLLRFEQLLEQRGVRAA